MTILVTGVSRGIGRAMIIELAKKGYDVIGITRSIEGIDAEIKSNPRMHLIEFDWENYVGLISKLEKLKLPTIDILINNAASIIIAELIHTTTEDLNRMMKANVLGPLKLTQTLINSKKLSSGCHVVNISSMAGYQGSSKFAGLGAYSMSKSALVCLTECMAAEWGDFITPNCLCLGAVNTEMLKTAFPDYKAPVDDVEMASFICEFSLSSKTIVHGQVFSIKKSDPN